jgi:hypothetical protein
VAEPSFLDEAIEEVVAAIAHHELVGPPGTAQRLFLEARSVIQQVLESPRRWPVEENGYRRWRLDAFPYSWRYERGGATFDSADASVDARRSHEQGRGQWGGPGRRVSRRQVANQVG